MNWFNRNPLKDGIKKYFLELLGNESYRNNIDIIEDFSREIETEKDYKKIGQLAAAIYEAGWTRAIKEQTAELEKLGLKTTIKRKPEEPKNPIFKQ